MDGNGRWATARGKPRSEGHLEGVKAAKRVVTAAAEAGLTVYQGVPLDASEAVDPVGGGDLASAGPYGWRF